MSSVMSAFSTSETQSTRLDLISDYTLFRPREWLIDDQQYICHFHSHFGSDSVRKSKSEEQWLDTCI
jgi:hypothetical protein